MLELNSRNQQNFFVTPFGFLRAGIFGQADRDVFLDKVFAISSFFSVDLSGLNLTLINQPTSGVWSFTTKIPISLIVDNLSGSGTWDLIS